MLIKALCDYADKREKNSREKEIPSGWCEQQVHFMINLSADGRIVSIDDIREEQTVKAKNGKESTTFVPKKIILPETPFKPATNAKLLDYRPKYIFGLAYNNGILTPEDKADNARKSHKAFVKHELEFFDDLDSDICNAYKNFIKNWIPENETENPELLHIGKNYEKSRFCFALTGGRGHLEDDEQFREKYARLIKEKESKSDTEDKTLPVCGILGVKAPVAKTHDKIKIPGGDPSGNILVGMNESAFESYGKTQSYNSNISEPAMKKYTAMLNKLLSDRCHRVMIDDLVIVFFAMKEDDTNECELMWNFLSDTPGASETEQFMQGMFEKAKGGATGDTSFEPDRNVIFYIAGLTANGTRICQKFLYRNTFGNIIDNLIQHQSDMQINAEKGRQIAFWQIKKELVRPKPKGKQTGGEKVPPTLMASILMSALNGTNYPNALLETVIRRVKTDSDKTDSDKTGSNEKKNHYIKLNDTRVGIIKACINRKLRKAGKKEEITMALNTENNDPAYLCGRLFAVYEKIQKDASGDLNRTIKDSYFASVCARPSAIMPKLSQLAQNHLRKLSTASNVYYNNLIGEIIDGFDGMFPQTLDLDSQGRFIVGYYQQNKALYTSSKTGE